MRTLTLTLWAIPYACRWSLGHLGVNYTVPAAGIAANKREEALQQAIAVVAASLVVGAVDPQAGVLVFGILGMVKVYNWFRIPG